MRYELERRIEQIEKMENVASVVIHIQMNKADLESSSYLLTSTSFSLYLSSFCCVHRTSIAVICHIIYYIFCFCVNKLNLHKSCAYVDFVSFSSLKTTSELSRCFPKRFLLFVVVVVVAGSMTNHPVESTIS